MISERSYQKGISLPSKRNFYWICRDGIRMAKDMKVVCNGLSQMEEEEGSVRHLIADIRV